MGKSQPTKGAGTAPKRKGVTVNLSEYCVGWDPYLEKVNSLFAKSVMENVREVLKLSMKDAEWWPSSNGRFKFSNPEIYPPLLLIEFGASDFATALLEEAEYVRSSDYRTAKERNESIKKTYNNLVKPWLKAAQEVDQAYQRLIATPLTEGED